MTLLMMCWIFLEGELHNSSGHYHLAMLGWRSCMPPSFKANFSARETIHFELGARKMQVINDGGIGIHYVDRNGHIFRKFPNVLSLEV
jgi:hypothetical protein